MCIMIHITLTFIRLFYIVGMFLAKLLLFLGIILLLLLEINLSIVLDKPPVIVSQDQKVFQLFGGSCNWRLPASQFT